MTTRQYIGARYIPVFADPVQWDSDNAYSYLTMVQNSGETFMSKQEVPVGIDLPNVSQGEESNDYWVHMSNWNAQVEIYRQEVLQYNGRISTVENDLPIADFDSTNTVKSYIDGIESGIKSVLPYSDFDSTNTVKKYVDDSISSSIASAVSDEDLKHVCVFDTVSDMKSADYLQDGMICKTLGFRSVGDNGGAWYVISDTGTANEMDVIECGAFYATLANYEHVTVEMFGAYGDDTHDDLPYIQRALNTAKIIEFSEKTYKVKLIDRIDDTVIRPYLNTVVTGNVVNGNNATLRMFNSNFDHYSFFIASDDSVIRDFTIIGDVDENQSATGEWGYGIAITGENVLVENCNISKCWGDSISVHVDSDTPKNVVIRNCEFHHCRRQGVSVISVDTILIEDCYIHHIQGISPRSGIDFEPYESTQKFVNCFVKNCIIEDCYEGIIIGNGYSLANNDVTVMDCVAPTLRVINVINSTTNIIKFKNCTINNWFDRPAITLCNDSDNTKIYFNDIDVYAPVPNNTTPGYDASVIFSRVVTDISGTPIQPQTALKNVMINNMKVVGDYYCFLFPQDNTLGVNLRFDPDTCSIDGIDFNAATFRSDNMVYTATLTKFNNVVNDNVYVNDNASTGYIVPFYRHMRFGSNWVANGEIGLYTTGSGMVRLINESATYKGTITTNRLPDNWYLADGGTMYKQGRSPAHTIDVPANSTVLLYFDAANKTISIVD